MRAGSSNSNGRSCGSSGARSSGSNNGFRDSSAVRSTGGRRAASDNGFRDSSAVRSTGGRRAASDNGFRDSSAVRSTGGRRAASDNGFRDSSAVRSSRPASDNGFRNSSAVRSSRPASDNGFRNSSAVRSTRPASDNGFRDSSAVRSNRPASDNGFRNSSAVRAHAGHSGFEAAPLGGANLARGSSGAAVSALQDRLRANGFDPGVSDGLFGPRTDRALRDYQHSRGLAVDGIAGPQTYGALNGGASATTAEARPVTEAVPGELPYRAMVRFAESMGFHVTSTTGGSHNPGSLHAQGRAIDVRTRDQSAASIERFIEAARAAGYNVRDERVRPAGQAVWSGPHLHLSQ